MRLSIAGWVQTIAFAVMLLLFISGNFGWTLLYAIIIAAALSIITAVVSRKHFTVSCSGASGVYSVGEEVKAEFVLTGRGFCFLPYITISGVFMGAPFAARCSLMGKRCSVTITARAQECCLQKLEVTEIRLRDMLGIIHLTSPERPQSCAAAVLPRSIDYTGPEVPPSLLPSDEETESEQPLINSGLPGYEHRKYVPGDSLRRINYKLSVKKRELMVRKNDPSAAEAVDILLLPGADGDCAEQAAALAERLVAQGGAARIICAGSFTASSPGELSRMREWLAFQDLSAIAETELRRSESISHTTVSISPGVITVN